MLIVVHVYCMHGMFSELQVTSAEELGWLLVDTAYLHGFGNFPGSSKSGARPTPRMKAWNSSPLIVGRSVAGSSINLTCINNPSLAVRWLYEPK